MCVQHVSLEVFFHYLSMVKLLFNIKTANSRLWLTACRKLLQLWANAEVSISCCTNQMCYCGFITSLSNYLFPFPSVLQRWLPSFRIRECPWVWTETCTSPTFWPKMLTLITAATPASSSHTPSSRRTPSHSKFWPVSRQHTHTDLLLSSILKHSS